MIFKVHTGHRYVLDSVVVEEEAFEEAEVVEPLDRLDAVVLQPETLQVRVLLKVLNLRESLHWKCKEFLRGD